MNVEDEVFGARFWIGGEDFFGDPLLEVGFLFSGGVDFGGVGVGCDGPADESGGVDEGFAT